MALSVRATLAQIEQAVAADRAGEVTIERLVIPPANTAFDGQPVPYGRLSRSQLAALLSSTRSTASALPEAVVAQVALGESTPVLGPAGSSPDVKERLLTGRLPVRPEDLPVLARALGVGGDARISSLQRRLRAVPEARGLPTLPAFGRRLTPERQVEGWSRYDEEYIGYSLPAEALLRRAGVADRATVPSPSASSDASAVPVPDVEGLSLTVEATVAAELRLQALRGLLWAAVLACGIGLVAVRRALDREAHAAARERRFLASVTHELRTPLSAIRLFGETLAEGRGDARDYGALVAEESQRLEALVERVLAVTRFDETPSFSRARPEDVVNSAVTLVAPRAERRRIALECRLATPMPEALWDADAVRRALLNLLDNALRHGRDGGCVQVRASVDGGVVRLSVSDDGPGIRRRDRTRIFDRFVRGDADTAGTGLGLHLVDLVARAHGGHVDLETEEGRGSTFTLVLPLVPPRRPAA
jgi:two-component system phosphate regulon sensor histidine kinase PhoR